jgi:hypothetical protein
MPFLSQELSIDEKKCMFLRIMHILQLYSFCLIFGPNHMSVRFPAQLALYQSHMPSGRSTAIHSNS